MKKRTLKTIKKISREIAPTGSLKGKVLPSKKRKLMEKLLDKQE